MDGWPGTFRWKWDILLTDPRGGNVFTKIIYIYIYIYRERERERKTCTHRHTHTNINIQGTLNYKFRSASLDRANMIYFYIKRATLIRRSTVLNSLSFYIYIYKYIYIYINVCVCVYVCVFVCVAHTKIKTYS